MKKLLTFVVSLLLLLLIAFLIISQINNSKPFFFIQMSDPQFGFLDANESIDKETILYERAVADINRLNPDFVVITGDFVHDHTDSTQWAGFDRITGMIKRSIPVYMVPGNHEYPSNPAEEDFVNYKSIYGDDKFSVKHKKNLFIGINSCLLKTDSPGLEKEQLEWLKSELESAGDMRNIVVFTHYPFFVKDPDEPETYSNIGLEKRKKYLDLLKKYDVKAVFAGHFHKNSYGNYKGMDMITTSAVGKQLGNDLSGLRIVRVTKDSVISNYYSLDDLESIKDFSEIESN